MKRLWVLLLSLVLVAGLLVPSPVSAYRPPYRESHNVFLQSVEAKTVRKEMKEFGSVLPTYIWLDVSRLKGTQDKRIVRSAVKRVVKQLRKYSHKNRLIRVVVKRPSKRQRNAAWSVERVPVVLGSHEVDPCENAEAVACANYTGMWVRPQFLFFSRHLREQIIAHEFWHVLGFRHSKQSVSTRCTFMQPYVSAPRKSLKRFVLKQYRCDYKTWRAVTKGSYKK